MMISNSVFGVISDTHGHVPDRVCRLLSGVAGIFHAGDIGCVDVLDVLSSIAPVHAVYGNVDTGSLSARLPRIGVFPAGCFKVVVIHDLGPSEVDPRAVEAEKGSLVIPMGLRRSVFEVIVGERPRVVIYGHTHRPAAIEIGGVLYFNPGSPTSVRDPQGRATVGLLDVSGDVPCWEHLFVEAHP